MSLGALAFACSEGAELDERVPSPSSGHAATSGGTPAPDGSPGFCCPAKTGGCGLQGGYREKGECPSSFDICDNMCEQKIDKDEHGCDVLTYKSPRVPTTYAGTESCSDARFNGGDWRDASADAQR